MFGLVHDDQLRPIVGAQVRVSRPITRRANDPYYVSLGALHGNTGHEGEWQIDTAPPI